MRHVLTGAAMLLVVGTTAACGGGAPTDASKEDFCEAYGAIDDINEDSTGEDLQDYAKDLEDVGTPDDMSDEERDGFKVYVDTLKDVDGDKKVTDLDEPELSDEEDKQGEAFTEYATDKCADEAPGGAGTDLPDEVETDDLPTDGATDVPIDPDDVPTDPEEMESYLDELESEMGDLESP